MCLHQWALFTCLLPSTRPSLLQPETSHIHLGVPSAHAAWQQAYSNYWMTYQSWTLHLVVIFCCKGRRRHYLRGVCSLLPPWHGELRYPRSQLGREVGPLLLFSPQFSELRDLHEKLKPSLPPPRHYSSQIIHSIMQLSNNAISMHAAKMMICGGLFIKMLYLNIKLSAQKE